MPTLKHSIGDTMTSLINTMLLFLNLFRPDGHDRNIVELSFAGISVSLTFTYDT